MRALKYVFIVMLLVGCKEEQVQEHRLTGRAFGTSFSIIYYGYDPAGTQRAIEEVIAVVNQSMSTYVPDSDISKINRGDSTVVVDEMFREVYTLSRKINKATSGYFDPTIGVLRNAYGFGDTQPLKVLDKHVLDSLMQMVGWDKVALTPGNRIIKAHRGVYFDFNAVAKGYGIDQISLYLEEQGVTDYLVELGGEVRAKGRNQTKLKSWVVGLEAINSTPGDRVYEATLVLENRSMAASGNYRKNRVDTLTGKQYVHTINPLTGSAERSDVLSATVLAPTCAEADAWATSFMALGLDKSKAVLAEHPEIDAYLTYENGTYVTEGFKSVLRD